MWRSGGSECSAGSRPFNGYHVRIKVVVCVNMSKAGKK